jgi:hypothetical protein
MGGYIQGWQYRNGSEAHLLDCSFTDTLQDAKSWATKEEAESNRDAFECKRITIPSAEGGTYVCEGFRTEQCKDGKFVVFCEAPFIPKV